MNPEHEHHVESEVMKWYRKPIYIVLGIVIIVFCFVPVVDVEYLVVVEKQVLEPYTVLEEVREPYTDYVREYYTDRFGRDTSRYIEETRWRTVTKEVTKTRLVTREVAETRTKRVSILRYLLR